MRIALILMIIYTVVLACAPCTDKVSGPSQASFNKKIETEGKSDHHLPDLCTPFCNCVCCASTLLHQRVEPTQQNRALTLDHVSAFYYLRFEASSELASIWQPPRL
ncbi:MULTISPECIES: DUF6660 family protein [unclassified Dyadobacter]